MSVDAWVTLVVLVVMFAAMATERLPAAAALGGAVGVLLLAGVIDEQQALSGLGSSAPVTIAALYVVAGAATATGAVFPLIDRVLGDGAVGVRHRLARLSVVTAGLSAVLPNTPLVALAAPRVVTWARRTGQRASLYLMPLSFAAVLGGVVTVIGTSTNLVVSDLLRANGDDPLGIVEITPAGLPVAVVGVAILVVAAPRLLARRAADDGAGLEQARRYTVAMVVDADGPMAGRTVEDAGLRRLRGVFLAGVERSGRVIPVRPETRLGAGDTCYFVGDVTDVVDLTEAAGLTIAEEPHLAGAVDQPDASLYEVVVSERSVLVGSSLAEVGFRARYDAAVLAIRRHDDVMPGKLGSVRLRPGDVLLVLAGPDFGRQWTGHGDFSVVAPLEEQPPPRRRGAPLVAVVIVAMVALAMSSVVSLMEASLLAAAALLVTRTVTLTEARRAINVNVVLSIATSISLGTAVGVSGLAAEAAAVLTRVGEPFGDVGLVVGVLLTTMVLTEILTNNAAAALMFPVALGAAAEQGLDPRALAIVVLVGASNSYLSPIGYQTNLMVYSLGGYRFGDFARLGVWLTMATLVVTPIVVPWAFPLR